MRPSTHPASSGAASRAAPRILLLPQVLANQIAAGEVVERPASVVKELLENSVDAGAGHVDIEIEQGGVSLIGVRDDGCGIHRDDLLLALSRHATSKIATLADLESVRSLGFRGEALPSIASVSRLRLASKARGEEAAWQVRVEGATASSSPEPLSLPDGMLVEVRDLFFNTPARRKFLRSAKTEYRHIEDVVRRIGLSHFHLSIKLAHNQKTIWSLPRAGDDTGQTRRLVKLCGKRFVDNAFRVEFEGGDMRLWGWVGLPEIARPQSDLQLMFLNGRAIRDRVITHAIRQAYENGLAPGAHPGFVLYLEMDPTLVDVNVHPAKHEVKFRQARLVHDFIHDAIRRSLAEEQGSVHTRDDRAAFIPASIGAARRPSTSGGQIAPPMSPYRALVSLERGAGGDLDEGRLGGALALLHDRFILAANQYGAVIVDWRAARRWHDLEKLRTAAARGRISSRPLLVPARVTVGTAEADRIDAGTVELGAYGIDMRRVGPETVAFHEVPIVMASVDPARLVGEIGSFIATRGGLPRLEDETAIAVLELLAEHSARHVEPPRTLAELNAFLRAMESMAHTTLAAGAPPGFWSTPWCKQLSEEELEKMVGSGA